MTETLRAPSYGRHRKTEFALVSILERLRDIAHDTGHAELAVPVGEALDRIADHHFSIAVVGEFNRGKSTFINALLGREILPADIVPTSATINRVTYGLKPAVTISFKEGEAPQAGADEAGGEGSRSRTIGIDELARYVTKLSEESSARAANIEESIVYYPNPFLKNNVDIIDTPGLSDEAAMTEVTLGVLPRVDAAILVVLATAPFAQTEARFLEDLLVDHGLARVLFLVTAMDRIEPADQRERLLDSIRQRIRTRILEHAGRRFGEGTEACEQYLARVGEPKVFGISGLEALRGKIERDEALCQASGLSRFEVFLEEFLTTESGLIALRTHIERVLKLCARLEKTLEAAIAASAPAPDGTDRERTNAFLLDAVESLGRKGTAQVEELAGRAREQATHSLTEFRTRLRDAAETALNELTFEAADLAPDRVRHSLDSLTGQLSERLAGSSREYRRELGERTRELWRQGAVRLLELRTVCDRVLLHLDDAAPAGEAAGTGPSGSSQGFDRVQGADEVRAALLGDSSAARDHRLSAAFSLSERWSSRVEVDAFAGPQIGFVRKAADLVRVEKFKIDLRRAVVKAVEHDLVRHADERRKALLGQLDEDFSRLGGAIEAIQERVRERRNAIERRQQRSAAEEERRQQQCAQGLEEIETIRQQARELQGNLADL